MDYIILTLAFPPIDHFLSFHISRNSFYDWFILSILSVALIEINRSSKSLLPHLYFLTLYKNVAVILFHFNGRDIPLLVSIIIASFSLVRITYLNKEKLVKFFLKEKKPKKQEDGYFENMDWNKIIDLIDPKNEEGFRDSSSHALMERAIKIFSFLTEKQKENDFLRDPQVAETIKRCRDIASGKVKTSKVLRRHDTYEDLIRAHPYLEKKKSDEKINITKEEAVDSSSGPSNEKLEEINKQLKGFIGLLSGGVPAAKETKALEKGYSAFVDIMEHYMRMHNKKSSSDRKE